MKLLDETEYFIQYIHIGLHIRYVWIYCSGNKQTEIQKLEEEKLERI